MATVPQQVDRHLLVDQTVFGQQHPSPQFGHHLLIDRRRGFRQDTLIKGGDNRVEQVRLLDRLDQAASDAQLARARDVFIAARRTQQQYRELGVRRGLADARHGLQTVLLERRQRRETILGEFDSHLPALEDLFEDLAVDRVVIDNQHPHPLHQRRFAAPGRLVAQPEAGSKAKCAAHALPALDPDAAPHHLDQLLRDRQTQPRAAEATRSRAIDLAEGVENLRLLIGGYADPRIAHRDLQ